MAWLVPGVDERNQWDLLHFNECFDCFAEDGYKAFISHTLECAFRIDKEHQRVHLVVLNTHAGMLIEELSVPRILQVDPGRCLAESELARIDDRKITWRFPLSWIVDQRVVFISGRVAFLSNTFLVCD